jgi:MFS family permease
VTAPARGGRAAGPNRLTPYRFVLAFGVVSMLGDFVYEGGRSIAGPYLATLGAGATLVGIVSGAGEAVALVLRLWTGPVSDRSGRHWALAISGYAITMVSVPLLAVAQAVAPASALVITERFGKAVRSPARDTMLAQASVDIGRGRAFAIHEAMDQSGALVGPLLVALMVAISGYRLGFAVLAIPGLLAMAAVLRLRSAVPQPAAYEHGAHAASKTMTVGGRFPARFWLYSAFTALTMTGFATFAVLAYHLQARHVISAPWIPVAYAAAMGAAALGALGAGIAYDRIGLRGMALLPPLAAAVPFLSFSTTPVLVWIGAVVWGAAMGVHESTMRAAVADLVPAGRRGAGYGTFTAVYGLAWLAGAAVIAALYSSSVGAAETFVVAVQAVALAAFVPLWRAP